VCILYTCVQRCVYLLVEWVGQLTVALSTTGILQCADNVLFKHTYTHHNTRLASPEPQVQHTDLLQPTCE
jgi:hypothetical protein